MTFIVTIRPEPGAAQTVEAGHEAGLAILACPLFEIAPLAWDPVPPEEIDALLIGSANAIRHAGEALELYRGKPVHAVGRNTAAVAGEAGLRMERVGEGGLQDILDAVDGPMRYLRLTGRERIDLSAPRGVSIAERAVYESHPVPLGNALAERFGRGALVLLHSAAAARHFRRECERHGIDLSAIRLACLGPRIAQAAGEGWGEARFASKPRDPALLALTADMCH